MKITRLVMDNEQRSLGVDFSTSDECDNAQLSYEYLRISSPASANKKQKNGDKLLESHKRNVAIIKIECVAKHGFRFTFDDGHNDIYSETYIVTLIQEYQIRWQRYLTELKASGHSREVMIDIKQL